MMTCYITFHALLALLLLPRVLIKTISLSLVLGIELGSFDRREDDEDNSVDLVEISQFYHLRHVFSMKRHHWREYTRVKEVNTHQ